MGFGTRLLLEAERIAREAGYKTRHHLGIGVREYYKNRGYKLEVLIW